MTSLLQSAIRDVLRPIMKSSAGVSVRYHSTVSGEVYDVTATLDGAGGEIETTEGVTIPFHVGVFKIDRADLPVMPQRLDRIEWIDITDTTRVEWFQVLSESAIDAIEPQGNFRDTWRINAKWVPAGDAVSTVVHGNAVGSAFGNQTGGAYGGPRR